jgi:hypothetical protein
MCVSGMSLNRSRRFLTIKFFPVVWGLGFADSSLLVAAGCDHSPRWLIVGSSYYLSDEVELTCCNHVSDAWHRVEGVVYGFVFDFHIFDLCRGYL